MTRPKRLLIALLVAAVLPSLALAGPGFGPRGDRGPGAGGHFFPPPGYLGLSGEQIEATRAIREKFREEMQALHETHRALREELGALLDGDAPDPAAVGRIVIDLHRERGRFRALHLAAEAEFAALLTEEQLGKWENFKELRAARRGPREGRGPHGRRGPHGDGAGFGDAFGGPPDE